MAKSDEKGLAKKYAKALQESLLEARGEAAAEQAAGELKELSLLSQGEAGMFFENPVFGVDEKRAVLKAFLKKHPVDPGMERFFDVVISLGHVKLLPEIFAAYEGVERERKNEVRATVKTAFQLSEPERKKLAAALGKASGKKVSIDVVVDPELIGGVVAEMGSVKYDASIRGYLHRMQQE